MHKSMQFVNVVNFKEPRYHKNQRKEAMPHFQPTPLEKTGVTESGMDEMYYRLLDKAD